MADFDPIRAQTEIVAGLTDVHKVIGTRASVAERALVEAEAEFNALAKLDRFVDGMLQAAQAELKKLREAKEREAGKR